MDPSNRLRPQKEMVDDPETGARVFNRIEVLRLLTIYSQKGEAPSQNAASTVSACSPKYCARCVVKLNLEARFCSKCGEQVTD